MATKPQATVDDLYHVDEDGKAEIVDGELVLMSPTGFLPGRASGEIFISLRDYEHLTQSGYAIADNAGFIVNLPNRRSFSPSAAFYTGESTGMKFLEGAPVFAAEVRSEEDYGKYAERKMARKRADYFAAGTLVVWDLDLLSEDVVKAYRAGDPEHPTIYRRGILQPGTAGSAVPGWSMPVDDLFI